MFIIPLPIPNMFLICLFLIISFLVLYVLLSMSSCLLYVTFVVILMLTSCCFILFVMCPSLYCFNKICVTCHVISSTFLDINLLIFENY